MKLIFDIFIWFVQLIYLVLVAVFKSIMQLFPNSSSTAQPHLHNNVERGKIFVRAFYYLDALESGYADTPEEANSTALSLFEPWSDPDADNRIIKRATAYAMQHHGGKQLPTIEEARAKGFKG